MRCGCRVAAARSDVSGPHDISPTCYGRFHLPGAHMSNGTPRKFARVFVSARIGLGGPRSLLSPFASALTSRSTPRVVAPRIVTLRHSSTSTPIFSARIVARNDTQTKTRLPALLHARAPPRTPRSSSTQRHRLSRSIAPHHLPKASAPPWPTRTVSSGKRSRVPAVSSGTAPPSCARTHATRCSRSQTFAHKPERHPAPP